MLELYSPADIGRLALAAAIGMGIACCLVRFGHRWGEVGGYALARKYFESQMPRLRKRGADVYLDGQLVDGVKSVWVESPLERAAEDAADQVDRCMAVDLE
jgi:hypothetical protein